MRLRDALERLLAEGHARDHAAIDPGQDVSLSGEEHAPAAVLVATLLVVGVVLIVIFAVWIPNDSPFWLPTIYDTTLKVTDWDSFVAQLRQMVLPATVLALYYAAQISRYMRSSMLDNLG